MRKFFSAEKKLPQKQGNRYEWSRFFVVLISCYSIFRVNNKLGLIVIFSILLQSFLSTYGLDDCINKSYHESENKDELYEYIEDLFYNIDTVQSTPYGFDFELKNINKHTDKTKVIEQESLDCISNKQYRSYFTNVFVAGIIFYYIYKFHVEKIITHKETTTIILLLTGMFDNLTEISYYIPEVTSKMGILKMNEDFLKKILVNYDEANLNKNFKLSHCNITFKNISFKYEKHMLLDKYNVVILLMRLILLCV
jgi:ABC-type multidrug transport system fused ATPase/permease subunit